MIEQFTQKDSGFWKWILWLAISSFAFAVVWSVNHLTPSLLTIALVMGGAGVAVSLVYTVYMTVNSRSLRRMGWACEACIIAGLVINLVIHIALTRRFDVATQARQARYLEQERELRFKQEAHASEMALIEKQAELAEREAARLANQARVTEAQNRQLWMLDRSKRRQIAPPAASQAEVGPKPVATIEAASGPILPTSISDPTVTASVSMSPEQVQENAWWWVIFGILAEVANIGGTVVYFGRGLVADRNRNGVPDWAEELPQDELLAKYPEYYRLLYGEPSPQPKQAPGYVQPVYAETRRPGK